jgi:cytochrome c biogenesis protein CcmG/thiol:disulfide interchange protein DsbE
MGAARAPQSQDPVKQAIADGDLWLSKRKYQAALDCYYRADKLSHHTSPDALLRIAAIEKKAGMLSDAASDAKKAIAAAGENKHLAAKARVVRAGLLAQMAQKPTDKKLKEAEEELRAAVALEPALPGARYDLGVILLRQERDSEGLAEMNAVLAMPATDSTMAIEARRMIVNPVRARTPFVPKFSFTTREKQVVSNASLRGQVTLIDFWGTWCPPCRASVPLLKNVQKKYAGKSFQLVSVSSDDDEEAWEKFIVAQRMDWSEYLDSSGDVQKIFRVDSYPTYIVVDKDGVVRYRQSGLGQETETDIEDAINKALKRESDPVLAKAADKEISIPESTTAAPSSIAKNAATAAGDAPVGGGRVEINRQQISTGSFKYDLLGLRYEYPEGWVVAKQEALKAANAQKDAETKAALLKQNLQSADDITFIPPKIIFYASQHGDGEPGRPALSSVRMQMQQSKLEVVDEGKFRDSMAKLMAAEGLKQAAAPTSFMVEKHKFVRADLERSIGALHYYESYLMTVTGDYLLKVEIFAPTMEELKTLAATIEKIEIDDEE